ncbi:hypothetical protein [Pseudomonas sp. NPDC089406]|uniref:hypothetical protein n=1 Tax=Pseudomonas sp. NPDC089406 TaxID=3364463 RepID=UPI00384AC9BC
MRMLWGVLLSLLLVAGGVQAEALPQEPVFTLDQAQGGELDIDQLAGDATLTLFYPTMAAGDTVGARLAGVVIRDTQIKTVTSPGMLRFSLARPWLRENLGRSIALTYSRKVKGAGSLLTSAVLPIKVVSSRGEQFAVNEAAQGRLQVDALGSDAKVSVLFPGMSVADTVGLRLVGVATRDAPIQTVSGAAPLTFSTPLAWWLENIGRSVSLSYSYKVAGQGAVVLSKPLVIEVVSAVVSASPPAAAVAERLNARFRNTDPCPGEQADYQCNGVFIRVVDYSPSFRAWNPSPGAQKLGGVSFSYIRRDLKMSKLQENRSHGLILSEGSRWAPPFYPLQVLCAFPYDAGTATRVGSGCGENKGYAGTGRCTTASLEDWHNRFVQYPPEEARYDHQCSFDPDKAGFDLSLKARENPDQENVRWRQNEVVIKTWDQNLRNLPVEAFFYTSAAGLEPAKSIQRDFYKETGRVVPVVGVSLSAEQVFTYKATDQAVQQR